MTERSKGSFTATHIIFCTALWLAMIGFTKANAETPLPSCIVAEHQTMDDGSIWVVCKDDGRKLYQTYSPNGWSDGDCKEVDGKFVCDYTWVNERKEEKTNAE